MKAFAYRLICVALFGAAAVHAASSVTGIENAIAHTTSGCNGAVVYTPQPGTQFFPLAIDVPEGGESFYAKAARLNVRWLDTMTCAPRRSHAALPSSAYYSSSTDSIMNPAWAGYQLSHTAQFVQAGWYVPQVSLPPSPGYVSYNTSAYEYDTAVWSGVGQGFGANTPAYGPLIQSGTESYIDINNNVQYYAWWQIFGGSQGTDNSNEITQIPVHAGDDVGAVSVWIPNSSYSPLGTTMLGICNYTSGYCIHFNKSNVETPGPTTEWIVEAPSNTNGILPLAKFSTVAFSGGCWAASTNLNITPGGVVQPVGSSSSGTVTCQSITASGSPMPLDIEQIISNGWQVWANAGSLNSNATAFNVTYSLIQ